MVVRHVWQHDVEDARVNGRGRLVVEVERARLHGAVLALADFDARRADAHLDGERSGGGLGQDGRSTALLEAAHATWQKELGQHCLTNFDFYLSALDFQN